MKKILALLLVMVMSVSLVACGGETKKEEKKDDGKNEEQKQDDGKEEENNENQKDEDKKDVGGNWKIGIMTGTVSQNEEEYRAAEKVVEKYGADKVLLMTYPDKFMDEQETTMANIQNMASDPDVKAIIIVQAVPGTSAGIQKAREIRDDILFITGTPGEDPNLISESADVVFNMDEISMGKTIIDQAKKMGAKTFVHYSFPRHMGYAMLSKRRDLLRENAKKEGIEFVEATAPDPTGDAGVTGAQQFILEDVPKKVAKYGKDTAFFSTNCSMQVPLIQSVIKTGAIYPQPCCPSPYHAFPQALEIEIPDDKKGDVQYAVDEITKAIADKGMTGRLSTWPRPTAMMFIEAGAEYAIRYINGEFTEKLNMEAIQEEFSKYAGVEVKLTPLVDEEYNRPNYIFVLMGFLDL